MIFLGRITRLKDFLQHDVSIPLNLLIQGCPGSGKKIFCQNYIYEGLKQNIGGVYVSTNDFPWEVVEVMKLQKMDISQHANIRFIDAFTFRLGDPAQIKTKFYIQNLADLTSLSLVVSKSLDDLKVKSRIVVDTLSAIFVYNNPQVALKFTQNLIAKLKAMGHSSIFIVDEGMLEPRISMALESICDGVLETKFENKEEKNGLELLVRCKFIHGVKHTTKWFTLFRE